MNPTMIATATPVTEIPARAMLDLEPLGGGGFRASYGTFVDLLGSLLLADYEGTLVSFDVAPETTLPVITYAASNMLEGVDKARTTQ